MMNKELNSFICEHTAEYSLIPAFIRIIKEKFSTIIPIYPWIRREGSNLSKHIHVNDEFILFGIYPRRPKFEKDNTDLITIKINQELINKAYIALNSGVTLIAGCPLVRNFWELGQNPRCIWIKLTNKTPEFYKIGINENYFTNNSNTLERSCILSDEKILSHLCSNTKKINHNEAINVIRTINSSNSYGFFSRTINYKPIYFLLKEFD
jgi:hypothetical protein